MQPISGDSEDNDVVAMLEDITKKGNDKPFVYAH